MEYPYEQLVTIDDINNITEMNTLQLAIQQEEEQDMTNQVPTHSYNLTERPTKQKERISLAIANDIKTTREEEKWQYMTIHPKVHDHVMLTQMNIKHGLLTFGERGN